MDFEVLRDIENDIPGIYYIMCKDIFDENTKEHIGKEKI